MKRRVVQAIMLPLSLVAGSVSATLPAADASSPLTSFVETFNGAPATPTPWNPANWDVSVHSRDTSTWSSPEPMAAHHGGDCGPHPATHAMASYERSVFSCRDHTMTAINASGYGVVYLTPDHQVDFSQGEAVVRFDLSTFRSSARDWVDLWISPYEDHLQLPLESFYPDLNGPPRRAVHVVMGNQGGRTNFRVFTYDQFGGRELAGTWWLTYEDFLTPSSSRRDTFELRLSKNRIKFGMPVHNRWWVDSAVPTLGWTRGIVQFGHHSYNPTKAEAGRVGSPNTWHWDNVQISPAVPFSIIGADRRVLDSTPGVVRFARPAPAGAHLRFTGLGEKVQVSFDGGRSWSDARTQAQSKVEQGLHGNNFWMPIPEGIQELHFRGVRAANGWWGDRWHVKDISIWAPTTTTTALVTTTTTAPVTTTTTAPVTVPSAITVRARGAVGGELMTLSIDGRTVATWPVTTAFATYTVPVAGSPSVSSVRIGFINDLYVPPIDRNLEVDWVQVNGSTYQAEDSRTISIGAWTGSNCGTQGTFRTQWLACNGHFDFRNVS